jgi:GNAT superfamily N-acetyltransferase
LSDDVPPTLRAADVEPPHGRWLVAYRGDEPVGCAGFKRLDDRTVEIKRLFVTPPARGDGISRSLLVRLEEIARDAGYRTARLDTGARQEASIALFSSSGYRQIADYNGNPYAGYWFEKALGRQA